MEFFDKRVAARKRGAGPPGTTQGGVEQHPEVPVATRPEGPRDDGRGRRSRSMARHGKQLNRKCTTTRCASSVVAPSVVHSYSRIDTMIGIRSLRCVAMPKGTSSSAMHVVSCGQNEGSAHPSVSALDGSALGSPLGHLGTPALSFAMTVVSGA